jgi:hypothetical protein
LLEEEQKPVRKIEERRREGDVTCTVSVEIVGELIAVARKAISRAFSALRREKRDISTIAPSHSFSLTLAHLHRRCERAYWRRLARARGAPCRDVISSVLSFLCRAALPTRKIGHERKKREGERENAYLWDGKLFQYEDLTPREKGSVTFKRGIL